MALELLVLAVESDTKGFDKLTLIGLANHANLALRGKAWPSLATLSDTTGLSRRSLNRSIARLVESGWVRREQPLGNRVAHYYLDRLYLAHLERVAEKAASRSDRSGASVIPFSGCQPDTLRPYSQGANLTPMGAKSASQGAKSAFQGVRLTPDPLKDPLKDPVKNPKRSDANNSRLETPKPEPERFGEVAAIAAPLGAPRPEAGGGSSSIPSILHINQEPTPKRSFREANPDLPVTGRDALARIASQLSSFGKVPK